MKDVVIFVGPSYPASDAAKFADFTYLYPAAQGDVYRSVIGGARIIGLIDGYFEGVPTVWHKEILFALARGTHVFGAASMGALRASELHSFGMQGIGTIFEWYLDGIVDADDEVALVHGPAPAGFISLSEPLVNVRATIRKAVVERVVSPEEGDKILESARKIFYKERTWERILASANTQLDESSRLNWLRDNRVDQKRMDAFALIETVARFRNRDPRPFRADFTFEATDAWAMATVEALQGEGISEQDRMILDESRLMPERFKVFKLGAALAMFGRESEGPDGHARINPSLIDRFRIEQGLTQNDRFRGWQTRTGISEEQLGALLTARHKAWTAINDSGDTFLREVVNEIRLSGLDENFLRRGERKTEAVSNTSPMILKSLSLHFLVEWFFTQRLKKPVPSDIEEICRELSLPDLEALRGLLGCEFVFTNAET